MNLKKIRLPGENSSLLRHLILLEGNGHINNEEGFVESARIGPSWEFEYRAGSFGKFSLQYNHEELTEDFELTDDIDIPIGRYSFIDFQGMYATPMGSLIQSIFTANFGGFFDGWRVSALAKPTWSVSKHLELGLGYEFNMLNLLREMKNLPRISGGLELWLCSIRNYPQGLSFNTTASMILSLLTFD